MTMRQFNKIVLVGVVLLGGTISIARATDIAAPIKAPAKAKVFFVEPKDGATVSPKFKVVFGVKGIKVRPAGESVEDHTSGHHHLIVDGAFVPVGQVVAKDDTHLHFGKGQTETELTLAPGKHSLTMQYADGAHLSYGESLSQTIHVEVKDK